MEKVDSQSELLIISSCPEDYRYEEVDVPEPGYQEVLVKVESTSVDVLTFRGCVKVEAVGICAGDAKTYDGATRFWGDGEGVPPYVEPPVIAGHEFSGRVVRLGPGAAEKHGVKLGDLTVSEQIVPCTDCK